MRLKIRVTTRSKRPKIDSVSGKELKIHLSSIPEHGKANEELIRILASHFKVPKSKVSIISGKTSRTKLVDIAFS